MKNNSMYWIGVSILCVSLQTACNQCQQEDKESKVDQAEPIDTGPSTASEQSPAADKPAVSPSLEISGTFRSAKKSKSDAESYLLVTESKEEISLDLTSGHFENLFVPNLAVLVTGVFSETEESPETAPKIFKVLKVNFLGDNILLRGVFNKGDKAKGTSTGYFLGGEELDLATHKLEKKFVEDQEAKIIGTYKTVKNKKGDARRVIEVYRILEI